MTAAELPAAAEQEVAVPDGRALLESASRPLLGAGFLAGGVAVAGAGLVVGGRRSIRTRYRPDPWRWPEWTVTASGAAALGAVLAATAAGAGAVHPSTSPVVLPVLPLLPAAGVLAALAPSWVAPSPERTGTA